jgi:predicted ATPase
MLQREDFPYLQSFVINDAYAVSNMTVPVFGPGESFKHLVLTGRNGSGKTTVLRAIVDVVRNDTSKVQSSASIVAQAKSQLAAGTQPQDHIHHYQKQINTLGKVTITYSGSPVSAAHRLLQSKSQTVIAFFEATRKVQVQDVSTVTKETDLAAQLTQNNPQNSPAALFKQYLVNKKVFQVFEVMEGNQALAQQEAQFFTELEKLLADIFAYPALKLEFVRENFEFYIHLAKGRRVTFNQLSAGFSAFLSILTDLLLRVDLLRKELKDYRYNPCGFVFIDEPETHLHLEMQYQILPWLTRLFPNLQFVVATHSPAVASSIKNATVFDLSTGEAMGDEAAGSSYSELMLTHFGVKDEYSNVADAILADINRIAALPDHAQARQEFLTLLEERGRYMSPGLRLEVEAQLIGLE